MHFLPRYSILVLIHLISLAFGYNVTKLRKIGSGAEGYADGARKNASFSRPMGVLQLDVNDKPCLLISDTGNHLIRLYDIVGGNVYRLAGSPSKPNRLFKT
jgi:hypothetical protein